MSAKHLSHWFENHCGKDWLVERVSVDRVRDFVIRICNMLRYRSLCLATWLGTTLFLQGADVRADIITFTDWTTFNNAILNAGTDTFNDLLGTAPFALPSPLNRTTAGSVYGYTAVASNDFLRQGTSPDWWLSTNFQNDSIVFSTFAPGINAIGGFFFPTVNGQFSTGSMTLTLRDVDNAMTTITFTPGSTTTFRGFISTSDLASLTVTPPSGMNATVNDLILGETHQAIPEPSTLVIMSMFGLSLGAGALVRKRRKKTCPSGKGT